MGTSNPFKDETGSNLPGKLINTAYDKIKVVADNISHVLGISDMITSGDAQNVLDAVDLTAADVVTTAQAVTNAEAQVALAIEQVALAEGQVSAATNQANAATVSAGEAAAEVVLAAAQVTLAEAQVALATAQKVLAEDAVAACTVIYDDFDDRYLGVKSSAPALDNDGNALVTGALYFNSSDNKMYVRNTSPGWQVPTANAIDVGVTDSGGYFTGANVEAVLAEIFVWFSSLWAALGSQANGEGASMVGVEDAAANFTGDTTEEVLAEIGSSLGGLNTKVIDIGDWDMDTSNAINVAHGLTTVNIRTISVIVRNDADTNYSPLHYRDGASGGGYYSVAGDNIGLGRDIGSSFDSTSYNQTSYNRGWITIQYID